MSPRPPGRASDDRDRQPPKSSPLGVVTQQWHNEDTGVHTEPWLFRALKDLKNDIGQVVTKQTSQGEDIAEIRGKVDILANFIPCPKSSTDGLAKTLLVDKLRAGADWRRWALRITGGALIAVAGGLVKWWIG